MSADDVDGLGDCFIVSAETVLFDLPDGWLLCHGTVWHEQQPRHWHAWIESPDGQLVLDLANGHRYALSAFTYYALGRVRDVQRYTRSEALQRMDERQNYGPWHSAAPDADRPAERPTAALSQ